MARRRGTLVLIAFLAAVMASGGGGVTAPWMPRPADGPAPTGPVAQAGPMAIGTRGRYRME
ncbi:MAG: hypothetical protein U0667_10655 [Chloroflexota bacterium]